MKEFRQLISIISLCTITTCSFAAREFASDPYIGLEAIQTNQHYKAGYGKHVFKNDMLNYAGFAGFNFHRNFGFELGYEIQPRKTKRVILTAGDSLPGMTKLTGSQSQGAQTSIKSMHQYIGMFAEFKEKLFYLKCKFQLLAGVSRTTVKAFTSNDLSINGPIPPIVRSYDKTKIVPMVKFSGMHNLNENFGVRLSFNYRHMQKFNVRSNQSSLYSRIKLKDVMGVGLGLVYVFK